MAISKLSVGIDDVSKQLKSTVRNSAYIVLGFLSSDALVLV